MTEQRKPIGIRGALARFRWIALAPVFAFLALAAWAFASPIGAGPDDDYHLISIWCADGGNSYCTAGNSADTRTVPEGFTQVTCFAQKPDLSAECQEQVWRDWGKRESVVQRGNFVGEYPPVYYAIMHILAGPDVQVSALAMRILTLGLFISIQVLLFIFLPVRRRETLLLGWLATLVPLGIFTLASNNPSAWSIIGVGSAFIALLGYLETEGRRSIGLAVIYLFAVLMASGARGDGAVYSVGASVCAILLGASFRKDWWKWFLLVLGGVSLAILIFAFQGQTGVASTGFGATGQQLPDNSQDAVKGQWSSLFAYNLLSLPALWTGVWGTWGLGWLDTMMPSVVPWAATSVFIVIAFRGLADLNLRKIVAALGVLAVLTILPVYLLTISGNIVGENLQPRYLLPLIVLFTFIMCSSSPGGPNLNFSSIQLFVIMAALSVAVVISLQINIRRYVTGADLQGLNLDSGAEWWWSSLPLTPMGVWALGSISFIALAANLWFYLRPNNSIQLTSKSL